jgi:hypothetical protein
MNSLAEIFSDVINPPAAAAPAVVKVRFEKPVPRDRDFETRRAQVLAMLAADPNLKRAAVFHSDLPGPVICTLAIRGAGTCELHIPRERFGDGFLIFEALRKLECQ